MTMNKDNLVNVLLSGLASLNIPGASLAINIGGHRIVPSMQLILGTVWKMR